MSTLYTLGHGTLGGDLFATTLRAAEVTTAIDVRRFPGSKRHPQFGSAEMQRWLQPIGYRGMPELGGRREPRPDSPNTGLRNSGFRGYADYMTTPEFRAAFDELVAYAREHPSAIFCAESLWWQCHRRLIADAAVLIAGMNVVHLSPSTRATHVPTPGVHREGDVLVYSARRS